MKYKFKIIYGILSLFLIVGCSNDEAGPSNTGEKVNITQISSKQTYDQKYANEAKKVLSQKDNIQKVFAVNSDELLIIAIEVPHHERFQLSDTNKKLSKEMDKKFKKDDISVELATDKKIIIELEALEKQIQNNSISKKELKKQLKHISKLLKEQT
ncbi:hypothetical protein [Paucisalibacillus sp. EB02]|uniref:hypothetical protein n=1 Tax=Paucisalibacillus sp. EB02 TaxID=1347087 RepID=UPI000694F288|nr:hypothetical protein [Paucisalibacillus sp. EB02]